MRPYDFEQEISFVDTPSALAAPMLLCHRTDSRAKVVLTEAQRAKRLGYRPP
jgi:hypothetical protein